MWPCADVWAKQVERRVMEKYDLDKNVERLVRLFRTRLGEDCGGTKITEDEIS